MKAYHTLAPLYDRKSRILILGSFPSVKSREAKFYYHHPRNRFWEVLSNLYQSEPLETIAMKKEFLSLHHIALWDVVASCEIKGSSDSSIRDVQVNDLQMIIDSCQIEYIYTNGNLADKLYHRYFDGVISIPVNKLPSTSPANAAYSLDKLISCWQVIKK